MPLNWQTATREAHEALEKRKYTKRDPEWEDLMNELQYGAGVVRINVADEKERGTLARSVGRRAAHRDFQVDIRYGDGFLSVTKATVAPELAKRRRTRSRESTDEGQ